MQPCAGKLTADGSLTAKLEGPGAPDDGYHALLRLAWGLLLAQHGPESAAGQHMRTYNRALALCFPGFYSPVTPRLQAVLYWQAWHHGYSRHACGSSILHCLGKCISPCQLKHLNRLVRR